MATFTVNTDNDTTFEMGINGIVKELDQAGSPEQLEYIVKKAAVAMMLDELSDTRVARNNKLVQEGASIDGFFDRLKEMILTEYNEVRMTGYAG